MNSPSHSLSRTTPQVAIASGKKAVKVDYQGELRRFEYDFNHFGFVFKTFFLQVLNLYRLEQSESLFKIQYLDDENDWIGLFSDVELQFGLQLFPKEHIFRLRILPKLNTSETPLTSSLQQTSLPSIQFPTSYLENSKNTTSMTQFHPMPPEMFYDGPITKGKMAGRFVCHVNIFDDAKLFPGTPFRKTWRFRNQSRDPWPSGCQLLFVGKSMDQMMGPQSVPILQCPQPNEEVDVSVDLVAPKLPGRYIGYWRLANSQGNKFGQRVRVQIQVVLPSS